VGVGVGVGVVTVVVERVSERAQERVCVCVCAYILILCVLHLRPGTVRGWKDARTRNDADCGGMGVHWNMAKRPGSK
jgi:hypothetical protein